ncbi:MAG: hypothetical protein ABIH65_03270 [Nanoarchaeota archaeon]
MKKKKRISKKGISEILATLLIILLVLAVAGIIWVIVKNLVGSNVEDIEMGSTRILLSIDNAQVILENNIGTAKVSVSRDSGEGNLTGVRFIFSDNENSYSIDRKTPISKLGKQTFRFNSEELGVDVATLLEVSIAPIYKAGNVEKMGQITDTSEIEIDTSINIISYSLHVDLLSTGGSVASSPGGISCGVDCEQNYESGEPVTLIATPEVGYAFVSWGGDCVGEPTNTCVLTMNAAKTVTATFTTTTIEYLLTVSKIGAGASVSTVTSDPVGIYCGADCNNNYISGTSVILSALAGTGYTFATWSGTGISCPGTGSCTVTMDAAKTVTATFVSSATSYLLNVQISGSGSVASAPYGISCYPDCNENYPAGQTVYLTATAASGWYFCPDSGGPGGWEVDCYGQHTNPCIITMNSVKTVTATFSSTSCILQTE